MKKIIAGLVILSLMIMPAAAAPILAEYSSDFISRQNTWRSHAPEADALNYMGLFLGTEKGYELNRTSTRTEALITVIRLLGKEHEALDQQKISTFTDVPEWAAHYVGWAQENNLIQGIGNNLFGANDNVTAVQYATMILRVLQYDDTKGDFIYENAIDFCRQINLIDSHAMQYFDTGTMEILRDDMVYFMFQALRSKLYGSDQLLVLHLSNYAAVDFEKAYGSLSKHNENIDEVRRALSNGYSEKWYLNLKATIENNANISEEQKTVLSDAVYRWLKEDGTNTAIEQLTYNLANLIIDVRDPSEDLLFTNKPDVMAYFQYPNRIILRSDLDTPTTFSTLTHELRHAMSHSMDLLILEEGMTEIWNHEVTSGLPGYPYHYLNLTKALTHLAGARAMNQADLTGNYEDVYYAIESKIGRSFDKSSVTVILTNLSQDHYRESNLDLLADQFLSIMKEYYNKEGENIIKNSANAEEFVDNLISFGQLLYYPSAMIRGAESETVTELPSSFYSEDFERFVQSMLVQYSELREDSLFSLKDYYARNKDSRFCRIYFGPDAGKMTTRIGMAYKVVYQFNHYYFYETFGSREEAETFSQKVSMIRIEEIPGGAFVIKNYTKKN